jgi:hypothetical protein
MIKFHSDLMEPTQGSNEIVFDEKVSMLDFDANLNKFRRVHTVYETTAAFFHPRRQLGESRLRGRSALVRYQDVLRSRDIAATSIRGRSLGRGRGLSVLGTFLSLVRSAHEWNLIWPSSYVNAEARLFDNGG